MVSGWPHSQQNAKKREAGMPIEISVSQPVLTIGQSSTFMVTDLAGEIPSGSELGVFAGDTRFVSHYGLFANGMSWNRLTSSTTTYFAARVYATNPLIHTEDGDIAEGSLALLLTRSVGEGIHEDIDLTNHGLTPAKFSLEIALRCDFADIFEVRTHKLVRRGRVSQDWDEGKQELRTDYVNHAFRRAVAFRLENCDSRPRYANGRITFDVELGPGKSWHTCGLYELTVGDVVHASNHPCDFEASKTEPDRLHGLWLDRAPRLTSSNEDVYRLYRQSLEDLGALRLHAHDIGPHEWLPAAGVPWYVAIFGRDSLVTSLQTMWLDSDVAATTLRTLGRFQADRDDPWRDAEPGKILHELRVGELAELKRIPHTPYYGTADATPLYLIALHEAYKWSGDLALVRTQRDVAERCLLWIDRYGDIDGDGFQEYRTRSSLGYENMGWKDATDAIVYPDGTQVKQPKALCELQGYVFDAWMRSAELMDALGENERARDLRGKAARLQRKFEEAFWCEELGTYCLGLDADKKQIRTVASNAGHCLWSGIASPEHAARVVKRLVLPDMWSGWGIRTLSAENPAYNPFSYQLGSVWPHDNGIIALGFRRYGFAAEAARIFRDISEAASYFVSYRLPELYAGIAHTPGTFPVQYAQANVPQAWAAGSVAHLLRAVLGLEGDAPRRRLIVGPALPPWLSDLTLRGIRVGKGSVDLRFWREDQRSRWEILAKSGDVEVEQQE
jgi:glycogen debranching enzyme